MEKFNEGDFVDFLVLADESGNGTENCVKAKFDDFEDAFERV